MSNMSFNRMVQVNTANLDPDAAQAEIKRLNLIQNQKMYHLPEIQRKLALQNPVATPRIEIQAGLNPNEDLIRAAKSINANANNASLFVILDLQSGVFSLQSTKQEGRYSPEQLVNMAHSTLLGSTLIVGFSSPDEAKSFYRRFAVNFRQPSKDNQTIALIGEFQ